MELKTEIFNAWYIFFFVVNIIVIIVSVILVFKQLNKSDRANRITEITLIIKLENLITDRNTHLLNLVQESMTIHNNRSSTEEQKKEIDDKVETAKIALLNTVERLCFLIKDNKSLITEYRNIIVDIVKNYESYYGPSSDFINTKKVNDTLKSS